jgi:hypothetical protein
VTSQGILTTSPNNSTNSTNSTSPSLRKRFDKSVSVSVAETFNKNIFNKTIDGVTASLDCVNCGTTGALDFDFSLNGGLFTSFSGSATLTPSGLGATAELGLTLSGDLTDEINESITLFQTALPGGIDIPGVFSLGPQLVVDASADISSVTAAATLSFGVAITIPDTATAKVDFTDSSNNAFSGWTPQFSAIGPSVDASVSVSGSAGPRIAVELDASALGKSIGAGVSLSAPEFTLDLSAQASTSGGICGNDDVQLGIEFNVNIGAELDAFGGLGAASSLPNPITLTSIATPIFSTCVTIDGTAPSTASATATASS